MYVDRLGKSINFTWIAIFIGLVDLHTGSPAGARYPLLQLGGLELCEAGVLLTALYLIIQVMHETNEVIKNKPATVLKVS